LRLFVQLFSKNSEYPRKITAYYSKKTIEIAPHLYYNKNSETE